MKRLLLAAVICLAAGPVTQPAERADLPSPKMNHGKTEAYYAKRHADILANHQSKQTQLLFIGASVIERWQTVGAETYHAEFDKYHVDDFGVGGDKTQHILWRIANGELDRVAPKVVIFNTGNNIDDNTVDENFAGFKAVVDAIHDKLPHARVLVIPQLPRGFDPTNAKVAAQRQKTKDLDAMLGKLDDGDKTRVLDVGKQFTDADGTAHKEILSDGIHPTAKGYQIWADAMRPTLDAMMAAPELK